MPKFDPKIIQQYAQALYDRADSLVWQAGVSGALVGAVGGGALGFGMRWAGFAFVPPLVVAVVVAAVSAISAAVKAEREVFRIRLEAQQALCQLMIERNTGVAAKYLQEMSLSLSRFAAAPPPTQSGGRPA